MYDMKCRIDFFLISVCHVFIKIKNNIKVFYIAENILIKNIKIFYILIFVIVLLVLLKNN